METLEETLEYRSYLCLAAVCGTLASDGLGSDGSYDDSGYFNAHLTELFGTDIDEVFASQHVGGVFGGRRWAFTDPENGFRGDDLEARLFHDRDRDVYYLVHRPSQTFDDKINNVLTVGGAGVPDKFGQAAQLIELVRPQFRDKLVLTGLSLGGGLAAYSAVRASWPVRTIAFDPLGLNRRMMGRRGLGLFGQGEVLSSQYRHLDDSVDWYYIAGSWVAKLNYERNLSSVGKVTELPQDPVRASNNPDTHDFRHVRFGLWRRWEERNTGGARPGTGEVHTIALEWASCSRSPDHYIMGIVHGTPLERHTTPEGSERRYSDWGDWVWTYPDLAEEDWHRALPTIQRRIATLEEKLKIMDGWAA